MAHAVDTSSYDDLDDIGSDSEIATENFTKATNHMKSLASSLDDGILLQFYAHYKQGTEGVCNIPRPSWLNTKGRAKWDAWNKLGNMSKNKAQTLYVELMQKIDSNFLTAPKESWVTVSTLQPDEQPLEDSKKSLIDYVKEGNNNQVTNILKSCKQDTKNLLNKLDEVGLGLIHWAADRGSSEVLQTLISFGADVNLVDSDLQTALHYAASCGHIDCIKVLLKCYADVNAKDAEGLDPKGVATDDEVRKVLESYM